MLTRRTLLGAAALAATVPSAFAKGPPPAAPVATPDDSDFWREIQESFTLDRTIINLNNGGCCPTPRVVHEAFKRYLDLSNQAPVYGMWELLEPGIESVRRDLARTAGCDPEELAITRNASEALQIAELGIDLSPGDEVLTTDQDYPRMLDTWEQRVRRDGIVLKKISFPVPGPPADDLLGRFQSAVTAKTKVIHLCHITNLTGHIFPVRAICDMARAKGITTIVDGAHAFAHFPFKISELGCDYYGTSLHKWLLAPVGTGFLWMRKDRIARHWGMQPTNVSRAADIRKFEEIGTHPAANHDAIAEALRFHEGIGAERKIARLHWLRARWTQRLGPKVKILTSANPAESGAIGTFSLDGVEPGKITSYLWSKWRILATPIVHPQFQGVRVTPNVYTTAAEIDVFCDAVESFPRA
jgi:isopenicillin-N epimerase